MILLELVLPGLGVLDRVGLVLGDPIADVLLALGLDLLEEGVLLGRDLVDRGDGPDLAGGDDRGLGDDHDDDDPDEEEDEEARRRARGPGRDEQSQAEEDREIEEEHEEDEHQPGPILAAERDVGHDEEEEQAEQERDEQGQEQADVAADGLAQDEPVAGDVVRQGQLQRPLLLLADDGVVGEEDGEEAEDDLDDEHEVEGAEDGEDRVAAVLGLDEVRVGGDVDRGDAADGLLDARDDGPEDLRRLADLDPDPGERAVVRLVLHVLLVEGQRGRVLLLLGPVVRHARVDREQDEDGAEKKGEDEFRAGDVVQDLFLDDVSEHAGLPRKIRG